MGWFILEAWKEFTSVNDETNKEIYGHYFLMDFFVPSVNELRPLQGGMFESNNVLREKEGEGWRERERKDGERKKSTGQYRVVMQLKKILMSCVL